MIYDGWEPDPNDCEVGDICIRETKFSGGPFVCECVQQRYGSNKQWVLAKDYDGHKIDYRHYKPPIRVEIPNYELPD